MNWIKIEKYYNTIRHLKLSQLFWQIRFRLSKKRVCNPDVCRHVGRQNMNLLFKGNLFNNTSYLERNSFNFLNLEKIFGNVIDWNFLEYGKLWNYNLEYFNYLNQASLELKEKVRLINDFYSFSIQNNRVLEPYPISLRSINIIKFVLKEDIGDEHFLKNTYQELYFLDKHYEYHILGNHLLENAFSLILGGAFFQKGRWHIRAKNILKKQLKEQILNDGAHFELSPMYHNIILYRVLELIDWYKNWTEADADFLRFCEEIASYMLSWLDKICFRNGDIPLFNDAAKGIAFSSDDIYNYASLLGVTKANLPLAESGYRSISNDVFEVKVDFAQIGATYQPGHVHADALSFILYYKGYPLLVEQGTSTYQIGERRDLERSTQAHNTVVVSDVNQSEVWDGFRVGNRAKTIIIQDKPSIIEAYHNGYNKIGVIHKRSFVFKDSGLEILDFLNKQSDGKAYFHLHPTTTVTPLDGGSVLINDSCIIRFEDHLKFNIETYEYSECYNTYAVAKRIVVDFDKQLSTRIDFT